MNMDPGLINQLQQKPNPFTPGEQLFWDDPHISAQMLKWHLDPNNDVASRRAETIKCSVDWIVEKTGLKIGDNVLDLGCGPGLYAFRLAEKRLRVTGVDYSRSSIDYALQYAAEHLLDIRYRYQNYLELKDENQYEAVLLIYGDLCPLSPDQRRTLLGNVRRALKPGGYFVLDVTTRNHREKHGNRKSWYAVEAGFWKPGPHLVLEEGFDYPDQSIFLDQAIVIEQNGQVSVYRNWFQDYDCATINAELQQAGFEVQSFWNDLLGTPFTIDTDWIGIIAQKQ